MQDVLDWLEHYDKAWVIQVFLVVLTTAVFNYLLRRLLVRLGNHADVTSNSWDNIVLESATLPLLLASWVIGLSIATEIVAPVAQSDLFQYAPLIRRLAAIALIMMFLTRFIRNAEKHYLVLRRRDKLDTDIITIRVVSRLLRLSVLITGALVILQTLGISVSGVVAFGGIGGIAIGFAAKDLLANFFGGLMIYLDRPFTVGDWIRSPDRDIEGTVEDIGWRLTRIRTFDKRPLYLPNAAFTTIAVENPSRMLHRRIKETFGLRYCDANKIHEIITAVRDMLVDHPDIDESQTLIVNFDTLSPSSLDFFIYTFTHTTDWVQFHQVKQDVLLKVIAIVHAHNADIAFPTRTLDGLPVAATSAQPN